MNSRRIHITGASGTGTTTLGRALASRLGSVFLDADDYFWESTHPPFQTKRPKEERLRLVVDAMTHSASFVLAGSICGWGRSVEDGFDLIVFLSLPAPLRLARLREREMVRYGKINQEFIDWAARYDEGDLSVRSRLLHETWLRERGCKVLSLEGDMSVEDRIEAVLKEEPNHALQPTPLTRRG
jgi:adenylate kinase family enzyme